MGDSNNEWGALEGDEQQEAWDGYAPIPEPGENPALDSFLTSKRLDHSALVRLGTRLSSGSVLAFAFPGGIKFRDILSGKRWNWTGAEFNSLKIIKARDVV